MSDEDEVEITTVELANVVHVRVNGTPDLVNRLSLWLGEGEGTWASYAVQRLDDGTMELVGQFLERDAERINEWVQNEGSPMQ